MRLLNLVCCVFLIFKEMISWKWFSTAVSGSFFVSGVSDDQNLRRNVTSLFVFSQQPNRSFVRFYIFGLLCMKIWRIGKRIHHSLVVVQWSTRRRLLENLSPRRLDFLIGALIYLQFLFQTHKKNGIVQNLGFICFSCWKMFKLICSARDCNYVSIP